MKEEYLNTNTEDTVTPLKFEPNDYRHHVEEFDLTEEQQNELLESLWTIMSTMVDIGWGVDTVQLLFPDLFTEVAPDSEKLLESNNTSEPENVVDIKKGKKK